MKVRVQILLCLFWVVPACSDGPETTPLTVSPEIEKRGASSADGLQANEDAETFQGDSDFKPKGDTVEWAEPSPDIRGPDGFAEAGESDVADALDASGVGRLDTVEGNDSLTEATDDGAKEDAEGDIELPPESGESPQTGDLRFEEVLVLASSDGATDPNEDGRLHPVEDEFVEIRNVSGKWLELEGVVIRERFFRKQARYRFPSKALLGPGKCLVVFGGGAPQLPVSEFPWVVATNEGVGHDLGLHLRNSGNRVELVAADGTALDAFAYGIGGVPLASSGSMVRGEDGEWTSHKALNPEGASFSPGRMWDGSPCSPE